MSLYAMTSVVFRLPQFLVFPFSVALTRTLIRSGSWSSSAPSAPPGNRRPPCRRSLVFAKALHGLGALQVRRDQAAVELDFASGTIPHLGDLDRKISKPSLYRTFRQIAVAHYRLFTFHPDVRTLIPKLCKLRFNGLRQQLLSNGIVRQSRINPFTDDISNFVVHKKEAL